MEQDQGNTMLPTIDICGVSLTRLMCGGNPFSGFSHFTHEMSWDMIRYYTMPHLLETLDECWKNGINTVQSRGDRHQMRMYLEHRERGGQMQWMAQTASEIVSTHANIREIMTYEPCAIYHHGSHVDTCWHNGKIDEIADIVKMIKDTGVPAGMASHIPEVIMYAEEKGWETDFYMTCFYNLARDFKLSPAINPDADAKEEFFPEDPARMVSVIQQVSKPCLAYKILASARSCTTPESTRAAFQYALDNIKPTDGMVVGVFQKYKNQIAEDAQIVREILEGSA